MINFNPHPLTKVAIVGTHLPRSCGIATFTTDLANAIEADLADRGEVVNVALDDTPIGYKYPDRVGCQIRENVQADYRRAADYIASSRADVVILQHEYGIFGGPAGAYVLDLLRKLDVPILTTLHTVLSEPAPDERLVLEELSQLSDRLIVICNRAKTILQKVYGVPAERIAVIPHGIPDVPFVDSSIYKDQFGAKDHRVILTFGLLSPNKGTEYMIEAMPEIVKCFPDALYIMLGATHPNLKREHGESYRTGLQQRVTKLGLQGNVRFLDQFVELEELCQYIAAADLYVTPYLSEAQISSGTLAYAAGSGKAIISTPYWYAQEILADGRGVFVPFRDSSAIAEAAVHLFMNEAERHRMRKRAYGFCRGMVWEQVAQEYLRLASKVLEEHDVRELLPEVRLLALPAGTTVATTV